MLVDPPRMRSALANCMVFKERPILILFAGRTTPGLARVRDAVAEQPDMEVVDRAGYQGTRLLYALKETAADVLVVPLEGGELPGVCSHIFNEYPYLTVIGVDHDRERAVLYHLRLERAEVRDFTPHCLANAIKTSVRTHTT